jgi:hypothetical protein
MNMKMIINCAIILMVLLAAFTAGMIYERASINRFGNMLCARYQGNGCYFKSFYETENARGYKCICPPNETRKDYIMV